MARIVKIDSVEKTTVIASESIGVSNTVQVYSPAGEDSLPIVGDFGVKVGIGGEGESILTDVDRSDEHRKSSPGDKRIFARDADTGEEVFEIWLKNDGTATISNSSVVVNISSDSAEINNGSGSISLESNGDVQINGVVIKPNGIVEAKEVSAETSLKVASKEVNLHIHPAGQPPGPTGPF